MSSAELPVFEELGPAARAVLRLVRSTRRPLRAVGVDPDKVARLLEVEFATAHRRATHQTRGQATVNALGTAVAVLVHLLLGGIAALAFLILDDPVWAMGLAQGVVAAFLVLALVGDHLPGLLDTADVDVIAPTPVGGRDVLVARLLHSGTWLAVTSGSLAAAPLVIGCAVFGVWPFAPVWLAAMLSTTATSVAASLALFLVAMRLFDAERFANLLLYGQIAAVVGVFAAFQILPQVVDVDALQELQGTRPWWIFVFPPFHTGGLLLFARGSPDPSTLPLTVLAVATPLVAVAAMLWIGGDGFVRRLSGLAAAGRGAPHLRPPRRPLRDLLRSLPARAGYDFFVAMCRRERMFRLRTAPLVAMSAVVGVAIAARNDGIADSPMLVAAIYMLGMNGAAFVLHSRYSEHHAARWLFQAAPLAEPGRFLVGTAIGLTCGFILPLVVLMTAFVLVVAGPSILPDALFAASAALVSSILAVLVLGHTLPFTAEPVKNPERTQIGTTALLGTSSLLWVAVHLLLRTVPGGLFLGTALLLAVAGLLLLRLRGRQPKDSWLRASRRPARSRRRRPPILTADEAPSAASHSP